MTSTTYRRAAQPGLPDPPLIREQLFLLTHDEDRHLRPWIDSRALSLGLAGAALIDLFAAASMPTLATEPAVGGRHTAGPAHEPVSLDPATRHVLHYLTECLTSVLPTLLLQAGPMLYEATWRGLANSGYFTADRSWGRARYNLTEVAPLNRIRGKVRQRINAPDTPVSLTVEALSALVWALNIPGCLILDIDRGEFHRLMQTTNARIANSAGPLDPLASIPPVAHAVRAAVEHLALAAM